MRALFLFITWKRVLVVMLACHASAVTFAQTCTVCRAEIGDTIYLVKDEVTLVKKEVCYRCGHEQPKCFLCSLPVLTNAPGAMTLEDGRTLCSRDGKTAVVGFEAGLQVAQEVRAWVNREFGRFLELPETNCSIALVDRPTLETMFRYPGRDQACPDIWGTTQVVTNKGVITYELNLLSGLPVELLRHTAVHELAHAWMFDNVSTARLEQIHRDSQEGFCELMAWLVDETCQDKDLKAYLRRNTYTRGQVDLFLEAQRRFGLNDVLDWLKYGRDGKVKADDLSHIRNVNMPGAQRGSGAEAKFVPAPVAAAPTYREIRLQGISWSAKAPTAIINGKTFGVDESVAIKVDGTNLLLRCLAIEKAWVRVAAGEREWELRLPER